MRTFRRNGTGILIWFIVLIFIFFDFCFTTYKLLAISLWSSTWPCFLYLLSLFLYQPLSCLYYPSEHMHVYVFILNYISILGKKKKTLSYQAAIHHILHWRQWGHFRNQRLGCFNAVGHFTAWQVNPMIIHLPVTGRCSILYFNNIPRNYNSTTQWKRKYKITSH